MSFGVWLFHNINAKCDINKVIIHIVIIPSPNSILFSKFNCSSGFTTYIISNICPKMYLYFYNSQTNEKLFLLLIHKMYILSPYPGQICPKVFNRLYLWCSILNDTFLLYFKSICSQWARLDPNLYPYILNLKILGCRVVLFKRLCRVWPLTCRQISL